MLRSRLASWQRRARFCAVACLAMGAAASCGGKAESAPTPGSGEGPPASAAAPHPSKPSGGSVPRLSGLPPEETCDDNPLLAKCTTSASAPTPAPTSVPPTPSTAQAKALSVTQVETVLVDSCGNCHGGAPLPGSYDCDGMCNVENLRRLVQNGNIVPCRWQDSPLFRRIADGSMPPAGSGQNAATTLKQMKPVGDFVNGLCSDLTDGGPGDTQRADVERWLGADCGSCHNPAGAAGGSAPSALDGVSDIAELITTGLIVPCDAEGSELVRTLRDNSMPPPGFSGPRPRRPELTELMAFINRPCSYR